jgi:hypothetical protein
MNRPIRRLTAFALAWLLIAGCIVHDELNTVTLHRDGSVQMVTFRSNLRSTQPGDEGKRELAEYRAAFDSRTQDEMLRVRESGGTIEQATWLREQVPLSHVVIVRFPTPASFEKFHSSVNDDGSAKFETHLQSDGTKRRLEISVTVREDALGPNGEPGESPGTLRQELANGISETRFAVEGGTITSAVGFTIAHDRQSALLDVHEIARLLHAQRGKATLFLEWTLDG